MGVIMKNKINYTGTGGGGNGGVIYSEEEREVGVWTDGKPLYQKTLHIASVPSNSYAYFDIADNIEFVVDIQGTLAGQAPIYVNRPDSSTAELYVTSALDNGVIKLFVRTYRATTGFADITCWYTKTTDQPGSGIWTTGGEYAHHYSTTERVIGTWIDGKTLYEKTINFGALPLTSTKTLAHNIANVDNIWVYDGFVYSTGGLFYQLNRSTNSSTYQWETTVDRTNVTMRDFAAFGNDHSAIITVRYTKTT